MSLRKQPRQEPPRPRRGLRFIVRGFILIVVTYVAATVIILGGVLFIGNSTTPKPLEVTQEPVVVTVPVIEIISTVQPTITLVPAVIATATFVPIPTCIPRVVVISTSNARIRTGPGLEFRAIGIAKPSEVFNFETYNVDNTWVRIGPDRWIFSELLSYPMC